MTIGLTVVIELCPLPEYADVVGTTSNVVRTWPISTIGTGAPDVRPQIYRVVVRRSCSDRRLPGVYRPSPAPIVIDLNDPEPKSPDRK